MKAILEFNLPEERDEWETANFAGEYRSTIVETLEWLRQMRKYQDMDAVMITEIEEKIFELLADRNIHLW